YDLPIINSDTSIGRPINRVKIMNNKKKAPPPFIPVTYGNFQMAPSPIAAPADANTKANLDVHCSFFLSMLLLPFSFFLSFNHTINNQYVDYFYFHYFSFFFHTNIWSTSV